MSTLFNNSGFISLSGTFAELARRTAEAPAEKTTDPVLEAEQRAIAARGVADLHRNLSSGIRDGSITDADQIDEQVIGTASALDSVDSPVTGTYLERGIENAYKGALQSLDEIRLRQRNDDLREQANRLLSSLVERDRNTTETVE